MLKDWTLRQRLSLVRNPHTPGGSSPHFQCGEWIHVEDSATGEKMFRTGQLDVAQPLPTESISALKKEKDPSLRIDSTLCTTALVFNVQSGPTRHKQLREAIAKAVDRKQVVRHILKRGDEEAMTVFPKALGKLAGYTPPPGIHFSPEEANSVLKKLDITREDLESTLSILYNSHDINQRIAESLQSSLKEHLGLNVRLENVEWKTFLDRVNKGNFSIARFSLCGMDDPLDWAKSSRLMVELTGRALPMRNTTPDWTKPAEQNPLMSSLNWQEKPRNRSCRAL